MEGHQLECGSLHSILLLDFEKYGRLTTDSMIKHAWDFLSKCKLFLETNHALPELLRANDSSIMDSIIEKTTFGPSELEDINYCQMYLNAITVADITEGDSCQITQEAIKGRKDEFRKSNYHWPYLPRPPKSAWKKW